ncbi:MAG: hypothetical protein OEZ65_09650 [Gemmatimonadota bacterium]|nr:hypothetical protein [Gemmatimonadota bacterium]
MGEDEHSAPDSVAGSADFEEVFSIYSEVSFEEDDSVINVAPIVKRGRSGGWLVSDPSEGQVREYDPDGSLRLAFGRKGEGPGEFSAVMAAVPSGDHDFVVLDAVRGIGRFSGSGQYLGAERKPEFSVLYDIAVVGDGFLLASGLPMIPESPMIVQLDLDADSVLDRWFVMRDMQVDWRLVASFGWVRMSVRSDSVAAVFALSDTVYVKGVGADSHVVERVPIPFSLPWSFPGSEDLARSSRLEISNRIRRVHDVFWVSPDLLVVQSLEKSNGEDVWTVLGLSRDGTRRFEVRSSPRLLAVADSIFLFASRDVRSPNRWLVTTLR